MWRVDPNWSLIDKVQDYTLWDKELYSSQVDDLQDRLLLGGSKTADCYTIHVGGNLPFNWINKGEFIAGSYIMHHLNTKIVASDIDIFFHSKDDALAFSNANPTLKLTKDLKISYYGYTNNRVINLIYGIPYNDGYDLLSSFDIRACAMGYDPITKDFIAVKGSIVDTKCRYIVWQMGCRAATIRRLVKYMGKGFTMPKYQQAILAELIKANIHSSELELIEGAYG